MSPRHPVRHKRLKLAPHPQEMTTCIAAVARSDDASASGARRSTGDISLIHTWADADGIRSTTQKVSTDKSANFYHCAKWADVNGDGRMDILAARAYKPLVLGNAEVRTDAHGSINSHCSP